MTSPLVEQAAEAAYLATMTLKEGYLPFQPWAELPDRWHRVYRAQATAILNVLQPPPPVIPAPEPDLPLFDLESP